MKNTLGLSLLVSTVLTTAASMAFATPSRVELSCTPTVGAGFTNYVDFASGLNRVSNIDITTGDAGIGGYGIVLHLSGTSGTGETAAKSNVKLAWAMAFGSSLLIYNNRNSTDFSVSNPLVQFELEPSEGTKTALGSLTVSSIPKGKRRIVQLTSRYNCKYQ